MTAHADALATYLGAFVDELAAAGLEHVCLCPGSRSTPLALMFARHPRIKVWTHLDERSCAYFALGMTRSYAPAAILCSSGTAAVNFAPAVVEASQNHSPLIVLTADRPQELRDLGANQTIDQVRLYGPAVKWFVEMPLPEDSEAMARYARMVARRAFDTAAGDAPGPVHLNFPFREPLVPSPYEFAPDEAHAAAAVRARIGLPPVELDDEDEDDDPDDVIEVDPATVRLHEDLRDELMLAKRGVIVAGPKADTHLTYVSEVASWLGFPVLADPLSNLRADLTGEGNVLGAYDAFLRSPALAESLKPDLILRIGAPPTSKPLSTYLQRHRDVRQIVLARPGAWPDPDLTAHAVVQLDADAAFRTLANRIVETDTDPSWIAAWKLAESRAIEATTAVIDDGGEVSEATAIVDLADVLPDGATVFAGNSMPVRDIDSFWPVGEKLTFFHANRGASGIDGVISTALGTAAVSEGPTVLVIGDLSFYHDMNGLLAARRHNLNATIVLINNDGGGIFSFLPQNEDQEHFETLFGTPHGLDFEPVAKLYGLGWVRVASREAYRACIEASIESGGVNVIEVRTERDANLKLHQRIWSAVAGAVAPGAGR